MTDGRFDSSFNMRPGGWDTRRHWTKSHAHYATDPKFVKDMMERESCPYHDLRADGCFQPERDGPGVESNPIRPEDLMKRKSGNRMATGAGVQQHRGRGMGGLPMPQDVEPAPVAPPATAPPPGGATGHAPWRSSGMGAKLFSNPEYVAAAPASPVRGVAPKSFHTGGRSGGAIGAPVRHLPEPFQDPKPYGRKPFRLTAGIPKVRDVIGPAPPCPPMERPKKRKVTEPPRVAMHSTKSLSGGFSHHPHHIPDPWEEPKIKQGKGPLFSYAAKTKRTMPVDVAWKAGTTAAEPPKPEAARVEALNHSAASVTARGKPRVGDFSLLRVK